MQTGQVGWQCQVASNLRLKCVRLTKRISWCLYVGRLGNLLQNKSNFVQTLSPTEGWIRGKRMRQDGLIASLSLWANITTGHNKDLLYVSERDRRLGGHTNQFPYYCPTHPLSLDIEKRLFLYLLVGGSVYCHNNPLTGRHYEHRVLLEKDRDNCNRQWGRQILAVLDEARNQNIGNIQKLWSCIVLWIFKS